MANANFYGVILNEGGAEVKDLFCNILPGVFQKLPVFLSFLTISVDSVTIS